LAFKRAQGIEYRRAEFVLNSFVRYMLDQYGERSASLDEAVTRWVARIEGRKAITVGNEFGVVRQLCLFRRRSDPHGFVPDHAVAPVKESVFVPYIFSHVEVLALLDAATRHEGRNMWGAMLRALTLVLYCTGMRLGEAARLSMKDVDLRRGVLTVRRSRRLDVICYARPLRQQAQIPHFLFSIVLRNGTNAFSKTFRSSLPALSEPRTRSTTQVQMGPAAGTQASLESVCRAVLSGNLSHRSSHLITPLNQSMCIGRYHHEATLRGVK
jgi:integrase